jgi:glyoxylase-like metal-dependent hydrolase (beta-lactamase superfamily II)/rhodanese-related sulfurtransferase
VIFRPYYLACLSHASYLVGDEGTREAAVVDPQRDVDGYLADAKRLGVEIRHVFLTHFHADFVSGHLELAKATGAEIHVGARAQAEYPFTPARDGDVLTLGRVSIRVLETPGHTPESICLLVEEKGGTGPRLLFTGDTLFVGDVGRPDLMASVGMASSDLAGMLYDSLHRKVLPLADDVLVYPAHGAGSLCGKNLSSEACSPLGVQRRTNWALAPMPRDRFVSLLTADQPEAPSYFGYDARLNRSRRATLDEAVAKAARPLSLERVLALAKEGATVLDARTAAEFASGHLAGSVNVPLTGRYAQWAGTLVERAKPIVVVAEPGREKEALTRLGRIGFDHVAGVLEGGPEAFLARPDLVRRVRRISAQEHEARLASASPPVVIDVRQPGEFRAAHVEGAKHVPLGKVLERRGEIPREGDVVVHCQTGFRSSIAVSLLQREGFTNLLDLVGGFAAWSERHAEAFPPP